MTPEQLQSHDVAPPMLDSTRSDALRQLVAGVLHVPLESVRPESDLVLELGAESIDFLDLIFGLDDIVGRRVLPEQWSDWIKVRVPTAGSGRGITVAVLEEFTAAQRDT